MIQYGHFGEMVMKRIIKKIHPNCQIYEKSSLPHLFSSIMQNNESTSLYWNVQYGRVLKEINNLCIWQFIFQ